MPFPVIGLERILWDAGCLSGRPELDWSSDLPLRCETSAGDVTESKNRPSRQKAAEWDGEARLGFILPGVSPRPEHLMVLV